MQLGPGASARQRALFSLHGLSVGDALGERFSDPPVTLAADLGVTLKQTVGKPLNCTPQ